MSKFRPVNKFNDLLRFCANEPIKLVAYTACISLITVTSCALFFTVRFSKITKHDRLWIDHAQGIEIYSGGNPVEVKMMPNQL